MKKRGFNCIHRLNANFYSLKARALHVAAAKAIYNLRLFFLPKIYMVIKLINVSLTLKAVQVYISDYV